MVSFYGPTRRQDHPGEGRIVPHQGLEKEGNEHDRTVEAEADHEHDEVARGKRDVPEQPKVDDRMLVLKFDIDEENQSYNGDNGT